MLTFIFLFVAEDETAEGVAKLVLDDIIDQITGRLSTLLRNLITFTFFPDQVKIGTVLIVMGFAKLYISAWLIFIRD